MKKRLSILIYSLANGGAERVVSILLNDLKDVYDINLFLMCDNIFYCVPDNVKITFLEKSSVDENGIKKLLKLPFLSYRYKKLNKSDVSLSFMNRPNYINIISKILGMKGKVVISERSMPSLQHKSGMQGKINKVLISRLYNFADIVASNSKGNSIDLEKNFGIKGVRVISNLIDVAEIIRLSKNDVSIKFGGFTFVTIGRLDVGKNHKLLIRAIKDINAKLYIIGNGTLKSDLEKEISNNNVGNKVFLLGKQKNPYKYLSTADCFIFGSSHEGFPNVLLEALACKLPVISTDCQSGPREILAPNSDVNFQLTEGVELSEYGILTTINDAKSLQEAMLKMMDNSDLRDSYKKKALDRARYFDKDKVMKKFLDLIEG